jgi:hypothetical protein
MATQRSKSKTKNAPWKPTVKPLTAGIEAASAIPGANNTTPTAEQQWAIGGLQNTAKTQADQFGPQQQALVNNLYQGAGLGQNAGMINDAYGSVSGALNPYLQSNYLDPMTNPHLGSALSTLQNDIYTDTASRAQLSGRPMFTNADSSDALGRGYAAGLAPLLMGQYNQNVAAQQGAAGQLSNAANQAAAGLDAGGVNKLNAQMAAQGAQAGMYDPYRAQLAASQANAQLPYTNLAAQQNYLLPMAQLGGQSKTSAQATIPEQSADPWQTAAGIGMSGLGILGGTGAFGGAGWLTSAFK